MPTTPIDTALSGEMALLLAGMSKLLASGQIGVSRCWANCVLLLVSVTDARLVGAQYVEGWMVPQVTPLPIEHGWLVLANGLVVDPTLPTNQGTYFAGVTYTLAEVTAFATKSLPRVWEQHGFGGFQHAGYLAAYRAALALTASQP